MVCVGKCPMGNGGGLLWPPSSTRCARKAPGAASSAAALKTDCDLANRVQSENKHVVDFMNLAYCLRNGAAAQDSPALNEKQSESPAGSSLCPPTGPARDASATRKIAPEELT